MKDTRKIHKKKEEEESDRIIAHYYEGEELLLFPFKVRGARGGIGGGRFCCVLIIG